MIARRRTLDQAIAELRAAIERTELAFDSMRSAWEDAGAPCCAGCMFGERWDRLVRKEARQLAALKILLRRRARRAAAALTSELRAAAAAR